MKEMRIEESEIHLWQLEQADFELSSLQSECLAWLTESELKRFRRYQFDRHRKQMLLGRVLMRVALSSYDRSVAAASWNFTHNDYGKPAISEEQNSASLYFNLSHSAEKVVLAVSRFKDIGIDVECARRPRRIAAVAQRYFSDKETAQLLSLPADQQQSRFYDLWTLKEAYIKACGMGLAIPLQHFSYGFSGDDGLTVEFDARRNDVEGAWQFWQLSAGSDFKLAVAAKAGEGALTHTLSGWRLIDLDKFLEQEVQVIRSK
ncbi:MAG: phosphopantetheinyl transferase [SAR86 cluster bacterium]|uniref:Phosphopantetheinyl transferase n=1 Tax=SAR86 cluster bacterium TaxID=2030880 RepID=A0A2A4XB97_9GAMM|nr:MAG: phosphopantetheinyl transferase [SAR86 cluster bacterium]